MRQFTFPALLLLSAVLSSPVVSTYADETDATRALEEARAKRKASPPPAASTATPSTKTTALSPSNASSEGPKAASVTDEKAEEAAIAAVPQVAIDAYVRGYFKARDYYADEARKRIEKAKKDQKEANTSFRFHSGKERQDAKTAATEALKSAEQELSDIMAHKKPFCVESLQDGGGLLAISNQLICTHKINNREAIMENVTCYAPVVVNGANGPSVVQEEPSRWELYVKGLDLTKFADKAPFSDEKQSSEKLLLVNGSESYQTAFGQRTLPLATPLEIKSIHRAAMKYLRENKPELLGLKGGGKQAK